MIVVYTNHVSNKGDVVTLYSKGDFHIHSTFSDGSCTPKEILKKAKRRGVDIIAITDHNTLEGIGEAMKEGDEIGVKVIPGVEISSRYDITKVHVLGYFKEVPTDERLFYVLRLIKNHNIRECSRFMQKEFNIAYRRDHMRVCNVISLLRCFNATVILAHPVLINRKYFKEIASLGFDGIEAKYFRNTEEDTSFFLDYASNHKMIYTAGSDFHTENELYRYHGTIGQVFLDSHEIKTFLNFLNTR